MIDILQSQMMTSWSMTFKMSSYMKHFTFTKIRPTAIVFSQQMKLMMSSCRALQILVFPRNENHLQFRWTSDDIFTHWIYGFLAWKWLNGILSCIYLIYWYNLNTNQTVYNNRCQITKKTWSWSQNFTGMMDTSMHYLPQFTTIKSLKNHAITNQTITRMLLRAKGVAKYFSIHLQAWHHYTL